jgi:uncharacterized C2H2 Zn-finger protein
MLEPIASRPVLEPAASSQIERPVLEPAARPSSASRTGRFKTPLPFQAIIKRSALKKCHTRDEIDNVITKAIKESDGKKCPFCCNPFKFKKYMVKHVKKNRCHLVKSAIAGLDSRNKTSELQEETVSQRSEPVSSVEPMDLCIPLEIADPGQETLQLWMGKIKIPESISNLDPEWRPFIEINDKLRNKYVVSAELHQQFVTFTKSHLSRLYDLTEAHRLSGLCLLALEYDSHQMRAEMLENQRQFWLLVHEKRSSATTQAPVNKTADTHVWCLSSSNEELQARFKAFLLKDPSRKSAVGKARKTVDGYVSDIFSSKSSSLSSFMAVNHADKSPCDLQFQPHKTNQHLDHSVIQFLIEVPQSTAKNLICAIISLFDYLLLLAGKTNMSTPSHRGAYTSYRYEVETLRATLSNQCPIFTAKSRAQSKANQKRAERLEPGLRERQRNAYTDYYRGPHFLDQLLMLESWARAVREGNKPQVSSKQFIRQTHWLMLNLALYNGLRAQDPTLLTNRHFLQKEHGSAVDLLEKYSDVRIDQAVTLDTGKGGHVNNIK